MSMEGCGGGGTFSPAKLIAVGLQWESETKGVASECEHQDWQGSFYKVCLLDFHCYSNYTPRFSHSAAPHRLCD